MLIPDVYNVQMFVNNTVRVTQPVGTRYFQMTSEQCKLVYVITIQTSQYFIIYQLGHG